MTVAVQSGWAAAEMASGGPGVFAWSLLAVLCVLSGLGGWALSGAIQKQWRHGDQAVPLISPSRAPDLAAPSTSPDALAEVAELEALWRKSAPSGRAACD
jgi:hypothetical protein